MVVRPLPDGLRTRAALGQGLLVWFSKRILAFWFVIGRKERAYSFKAAAGCECFRSSRSVNGGFGRWNVRVC